MDEYADRAVECEVVRMAVNEKPRAINVILGGDMEERKQIEEMANCLCREYGTDRCNPDCGAHGHCNIYFDCKVLYNAGYRKQSEGEWVWISDDDVMCTTCGRVFNSNDNADAGLSSWRFCPNCGAKMKGE